jgi:hypothetical protein
MAISLHPDAAVTPELYDVSFEQLLNDDRTADLLKLDPKEDIVRKTYRRMLDVLEFTLDRLGQVEGFYPQHCRHVVVLEHGMSILWRKATLASLVGKGRKPRSWQMSKEDMGEVKKTRFVFRQPLLRGRGDRQDVSFSNYSAGHLIALSEALRIEIEDVITLAFCASFSRSEYLIDQDSIRAFKQTMNVFDAMFPPALD